MEVEMRKIYIILLLMISYTFCFTQDIAQPTIFVMPIHKDKIATKDLMKDDMYRRGVSTLSKLLEEKLFQIADIEDYLNKQQVDKLLDGHQASSDASVVASQYPGEFILQFTLSTTTEGPGFKKVSIEFTLLENGTGLRVGSGIGTSGPPRAGNDMNQLVQMSAENAFPEAVSSIGKAWGSIREKGYALNIEIVLKQKTSASVNGKRIDQTFNNFLGDELKAGSIKTKIAKPVGNVLSAQLKMDLVKVPPGSESEWGIKIAEYFKKELGIELDGPLPRGKLLTYKEQ